MALANDKFYFLFHTTGLSKVEKAEKAEKAKNNAATLASTLAERDI